MSFIVTQYSSVKSKNGDATELIIIILTDKDANLKINAVIRTIVVSERKKVSQYRRFSTADRFKYLGNALKKKKMYEVDDKTTAQEELYVSVLWY